MTAAQPTLSWRGLDLRWVYGDLLVSIGRQTRCFHRACDVLQDALVRYMLHVPKAPIEVPHAYLRVVVSSVLADHRADAARFSPLPAHADDAGASHQALYAPSAERLADLQQRLEMLQRVIDCLPPRCREVFWLYRIEGMAQSEIAARLGVTLNMVERHVMRALVDLRSLRDELVA